MSKAVRRTITVLVVLAILLGVVGWFLSNMIIAEMAVKPVDRPFDHEITAVTENTISYRPPESVSEKYTTNWTGMFLEDGYIQLAQDAQVDNGIVTRGYRVISGEPPAAGDKGRMDWAAWPDAESQGLVAKSVTYDAPLGPTPAVQVQPVADAEPGRWAIVVHGIGGTNREGLRMAKLLAERGYTGLYINYRDDWQEPDVPAEDGIGNFGQTEWEDLKAAVDYATENGAEEVLLVGYSMGGAVVSSYMEREGADSPVIGVVMYAPAVSFSDAVTFGAELMGFPVKLIAPIMWVGKKVTELRTGVSFNKVNYIKRADQWQVPVLVTACEKDDLVPPSSVENFASRLRDGEYRLFEDAYHVGEWNVGPEQYEQIVGGWLDRLN